MMPDDARQDYIGECIADGFEASRRLKPVLCRGPDMSYARPQPPLGSRNLMRLVINRAFPLVWLLTVPFLWFGARQHLNY